MDSRIVNFIKEHHVLTLATSKDNIPWTAHCFYAFLEEDNALVFTTDDDTRHGMEMLDNQVVSGGIVLETKVVGKIRGVQLTGTVLRLDGGGMPKGPGLRQDDTHVDEHSLSSTERVSSLRKQGPPGELPLKQAKSAYLKRFPYAILMKTNLWVLEIDTIKFTDNRLGFGKKLFWDR